MTQVERRLLFEELCARLPYGVIVQYPNIFKPSEIIKRRLEEISYSLIGINEYRININDDGIDIEYVRPYLRPMSSMTEKEREHLQTLHDIISDENYGDGFSPAAWNAILLFNNYCHKRHLDNAGLIEKGLALEALKDMY